MEKSHLSNFQVKKANKQKMMRTEFKKKSKVKPQKSKFKPEKILGLPEKKTPRPT